MLWDRSLLTKMSIWELDPNPEDYQAYTKVDKLPKLENGKNKIYGIVVKE